MLSGKIEPTGSQPAATSWHCLSAEQAAEQLSVDASAGLTSEEAAARLLAAGPNELAEGRRVHPVVKLLGQFASPLIIVLLVSAVISAVLSDWKDAIVIGVIVVLNGVIGFVQEHRADKAIEALREMAVPNVRLRRDGRVIEVPAPQVAPGDVLLLNAGDVIAADGRVFVHADLRVEEAALTGESLPVQKTSEPLGDPDLLPGDRVNMVYKGTAVVHGRGEAVVVATGMATELGKVAAALAATRKTGTPLQARLNSLGKWLALVALAICAALFALGMAQGGDFRVMFMTAVALAVAAIPEGLPAVVTIALAIGARAMARQRALVRSLPAVEGLGSVTVICSDKTGTLTANEMTVRDIVADGMQWKVSGVGCDASGGFREAGADEPVAPPDSLLALLRGVALCNDARVELPAEGDPECRFIGDPTEAALILAAVKAGIDVASLQDAHPRVAEVPFSSTTKRMATLHGAGGEAVVYAKGAPESILPLCSHIRRNGEVLALSPDQSRWVSESVESLAGRGRRVLAVASRSFPSPEHPAPEDLERDLVLLGLVGMIDPPRPEAAASVEQCQSASIRAVMITGDHALTAKAVAQELGIFREGQEVLTGTELSRMSAEELRAHVDRVSVYARVSPEHKLSIVEALQEHQQVVAMTGDGVNDAPALKRADIGIAMGLTGTDVAREASELVLADDNFATIVAAVREGRVIYENLRKFLRFMLSTNLAEVLTIAVAMALGWPIPLLPLQILWINLVTDGPPALALSMEPAEADIMRHPPRRPGEGLLAGGMVRGVLLGSVLMAFAVLLLVRNAGDLEHRQTLAFTSLALAQLLAAMALRSLHRPFWRAGLFRNPAMWGAFAAGCAAQLAVVYVPALQHVFGTVALSLAELGLCVLAGLFVMVGIEADKCIQRRCGLVRAESA